MGNKNNPSVGSTLYYHSRFFKEILTFKISGLTICSVMHRRSQKISVSLEPELYERAKASLRKGEPFSQMVAEALELLLVQKKAAHKQGANMGKHLGSLETKLDRVLELLGERAAKSAKPKKAYAGADDVGFLARAAKAKAGAGARAR